MIPPASVPANDDQPFQLRRYFSRTSGLLILVLVGLLAFAYHYSEVIENTDHAGQRNEMLARIYANSLWPTYGAFLLRADIDHVARRNDGEMLVLHERIRQMSQEIAVIKVKVYNPHGVAVYSSVLNEIGENKSDNQAFQKALQGKLVNELTHRGKISASEGEMQDVDLVSTYIPIRTHADQPVQAVFELYSNVTDTVANIESTTARLFLGLWAVFLVLYLSLLAIVGHADKILQRQYASLKDNEARLQMQTAGQQREIFERQAIEAALRRSEKLAATANRAKSDFLSGMSHELRTPLNSILGFAQLLDTEPDAPLSINQKIFAQQISKAGEHLLGLINQALDLSIIEAGKLSLSIESVSVETVLMECLPLVQNLATQRQIQPIALDVGGVWVLGDIIRLRQVLLNLLSNAIKFNRVGGSVLVSAVAGDLRVRIEVTDTGNGIPEDKQAELFQPFSRLGVQSADVEGTGIGLTLSKRLIESMAGTIGVRSEVGRGTTFWLDLPAATGTVPLPAGEQDSDHGRLGAALTSVADAYSGTILYIEDNPANVLLMSELMRRIAGVRLITAHDAETGIALARAECPDLIILDINLPGIDGFEALRRLREHPGTAVIPVMAVSANAMPEDIARGIAAGFIEYHTKPIQLDKFLRSVSQQLEGVRA